MSGTSFLTTVGRDKMASIIAGRISYFKIGEGGFVLSGEISEVIDASASGSQRIYSYTISGGDFPIIDVDQVLNSFVISGEHASFFPDGVLIQIADSVSNNGNYFVATSGASESGGNTIIKVNETIPSPTVDGYLAVSRLPVAKGPTDDAKHFPLAIEELSPSLAVVQSISDASGSGTLSGDGTGTINYKNGNINAVFYNNVAAGNSVVIRFKYHDLKKDASLGEGYTDLESESSLVSVDGKRELFTYRKSFGSDANTVVILRGTGYATIRCKINLNGIEGIDDGRGLTYGGTPYYFEGGVYDTNDVMLGYFTFDKIKKVAPLEIVHTFDFVF